MSCPSVYAESVVCGLVDGSIEKNTVLPRNNRAGMNIETCSVHKIRSLFERLSTTLRLLSMAFCTE